MGQAKVRKKNNPLYGVVPKKGVVSPLWLVHKDVLFLVGEGDSLACLPAGNRIVPNETQLKVLEEILSSNPSLLNQAPVIQSTDVIIPSDDSTSNGTMDMTTEGCGMPSNVTTINPPMVGLL